ncbi:hypothetical protein FHS29_002906 [Saccharothrix tamanrassetensis]|uniref:Uncharacterized protein n=1 Tax=Saccharothrix tamanrassetensis TaxID=1051531 RepID=A0A841CH56_9PSEU|nr:hypothetical protein [Saccharothrix tamanrassetensis]MBB5956320.1 hypothetical protein [Saccharothrix tamanrassetensis]
MPTDGDPGARTADARPAGAGTADDEIADIGIIIDPDTYTRAVPHDALTRLRRRGVVRADDFVAVFRHADVRTVLRTRDLLLLAEPAGEPTRLRSNFRNGARSLPVRHQLGSSPIQRWSD